jgi:hypothetical protein
MYENKDIILAVDYHDQNLVIRRFDCSTGEENVFKRPTTAEAITQVISQARQELADGDSKVVWVMESTSGWARVKELLDSSVVFQMANVLQMPLPPKARRRKTDKIDTARILREYLTGTLPLAYQPTRRDGHIGGGGTDKRLRHYIIEATLWAREIPRYRPTYERVCAKRGKKIGRLVVGRMLLRSIYKMLRDDVNFHAGMTQKTVLAN